MPHQYGSLVAHLDDVHHKAGALLGAVNVELGINLPASPPRTFPSFPIPGATSRFLKRFPRSPDNYLLVTGRQRHFLLHQPSVSPCAWHAWGQCRSIHENQGEAAIADRSYDPASFFITEEPHHCAHRTVHGRRNAGKCHIASFEQYLCCRACIFKSVCWSRHELQALPCGILPIGMRDLHHSVEVNAELPAK